MRPIFHQIELRVKAHIFVAALAFLVQRLLGRRRTEAGVDLSPERALEALSTVRLVTFRAWRTQPDKPGSDRGLSRRPVGNEGPASSSTEVTAGRHARGRKPSCSDWMQTLSSSTAGAPPPAGPAGSSRGMAEGCSDARPTESRPTTTAGHNPKGNAMM